MTGVIHRINPPRGFGFIRIDGETTSQGDHFFHCRDLVDFVFDERLVGQRCEFDGIAGEKGLVATNVRPIV